MVFETSSGPDHPASLARPHTGGTVAGRKCAVLTMDVEDWYHLDYFDRERCDRGHSLLDGIEVYRGLLAQEGLVSSYFVLGELASRLAGLLRELATAGNDIGSHGWDHRRPLTLSPTQLGEDLRRSKQELEDALQSPVLGYRAPCFSLDRARLDQVQAAGYAYDSSRIDFGSHPLYGTLDLHGFERIQDGVFRQGAFVEFEVSTLKLLGRQVPVSGGGYLRLIPWPLMRHWIKRYLSGHELYVLYIHPFELSAQAAPPLPSDTGSLTRYRFSVGRAKVRDRLRRLIELLRRKGFEFTTFAQRRAHVQATVAQAIQET